MLTRSLSVWNRHNLVVHCFEAAANLTLAFLRDKLENPIIAVRMAECKKEEQMSQGNPNFPGGEY